LVVASRHLPGPLGEGHLLIKLREHLMPGHNKLEKLTKIYQGRVDSLLAHLRDQQIQTLSDRFVVETVNGLCGISHTIDY
jgi:hypothetical protein